MTFGSMIVDSVEDVYFKSCEGSKGDERNDVFFDSMIEAFDKGLELRDSFYFKKGMEFSGNKDVTYDDLDDRIHKSFDRAITP